MSEETITLLNTEDPKSQEPGSKEPPPLHMPTIYAVVATVFLQSIGFSIVLPSLWPYLQYIDKHVSLGFLGWVTSIYSVGQFLGSTVFGWFTNFMDTRTVLHLTLIITIIGNIFYSIAPAFSFGLYVVLISRLVVGLGAGNIATCRAYVSHATNLENRTKIMAYTSAAQGLGFVVGPALATGLNFIHIPLSGKLQIDKYTSVGYVSTLLAILNMVWLISIPFKEMHHARSENKSGSKGALIPRSEFINICIVIYLFFVIITVFSMFETITTPMFKQYYGWNIAKTGQYFVVVAALSVVSFLVVSLPWVRKNIDERLLMLVGGFGLCGVSLLLMAKWTNNTPPKLQLFSGGFLLSFAYPTASLLIFTIFSKIIHPIAQGPKMGWLTAGGSFARIIGPIWATNVFNSGDYGPAVLFISTAEFVFFACFVIIVAYDRLVPHPEQLKPAQNTIQA